MTSIFILWSPLNLSAFPDLFIIVPATAITSRVTSGNLLPLARIWRAAGMVVTTEFHGNRL